ncbi:hypothetical protein ACJ72_07375 [Emergomyces africanus]|uniref:HNH nuclease domain-containing protein n=1 Tax=Emergomyces africanus TaxID=1955775 RepID=A0A1B7NNG0_9EURO|nr:hypothetical protein ACJ72_07375 [Emergomyces africanus]
MASRPSIPPGSSRKRLCDELDDLNHEITRKRRQLRPRGSFDSEYWKTALDIVRNEAARNTIRKQISTEKFKVEGGSEEDWATTEDAKQLQVELEILKLKERKCRDQMRRVQSGSGGPDSEANTVSLRRSYLELFISSSRGLGISFYGGGRESEAQSTFRASVIEAYNAQNSGIEYEDCLWCPILSRWFAKEDITASHIFSYRHGQQAMTAIFGETQEPELFSPKNGLLISNYVEANFEAGLFVIVPDLPENPASEAIIEWHRSEPKEYKLKIIDHDPTKLDRIIPYGGIRWRELDGKRLEFRSDYRPRAQYLYFRYCLQILRRAFTERWQGQVLRESELEKPAWSSPGKFLKRNMLLAFVDEIGHKYDHLLDCSAKTDNNLEAKEEDDLLLLTATRQIGLAQEDEEGSDDEDEDSADDNELI